MKTADKAGMDKFALRDTCADFTKVYSGCWNVGHLRIVYGKMLRLTRAEQMECLWNRRRRGVYSVEVS